jgi:hypothetical protein
MDLVPFSGVKEAIEAVHTWSVLATLIQPRKGRPLLYINIVIGHLGLDEGGPQLPILGHRQLALKRRARVHHPSHRPVDHSLEPLT